MNRPKNYVELEPIGNSVEVEKWRLSDDEQTTATTAEETKEETQ